MNKFYTGLLSLSLFGCLPQEVKDPQMPIVTIEDEEIVPEENNVSYEEIPAICVKTELKEGNYRVLVNGNVERYSVSLSPLLNICSLFLKNDDWVNDEHCDGKVDSVNRRFYEIKRSKLERLKVADDFDSMLEEAQKYVCFNNKIIINEKKLIKDILKPYQ